MDDHTIAVTEKNKTEEIRISLCEYKGHKLVSLRVFTEPYADHGQGRVPTKKGINCRVTLLPQIVEALQEAEAEVRKAGLL